MSCVATIQPYIKIGDSFDVPIQLTNTKDNTGIEITSNMELSAKIVDISGNTIGEPTIAPYPDQVNDKGFALMSLSPTITSTWAVGKAKFDIKVVIDGTVKHSQDFSFFIKEAIT